jgi:MoCo/4Fe-4S cofactor protein with predicted Tat translocation signal
MDKKLGLTYLTKKNSAGTDKNVCPTNGTGYWRSFGELYNDPKFIEAAKGEMAKEIEERSKGQKVEGDILNQVQDDKAIVSRRKFLSLMSASAALAAAGCSNYRDKGEVIPYNKKPEEITLGNPNFYASTCAGCQNACGILIKTREGRPIKVDGNPDHPINQGKICARGQASILNMYDPDRLREPGKVEKSEGRKVELSGISWGEVDEKVIAELKNAAGAGRSIAIVSHRVISPTQKKLLEQFAATYPTAKVYSYEVVNDEPRRSAWMKCYGTRNVPVIKWGEAKIIVSLECDFLGTEGNVMEQTREYVKNRDAVNPPRPSADGHPSGEGTIPDFNRLYSVEGAYSLTGMNADYRIRLRTDAIEEFVLSLLNKLAPSETGLSDSRFLREGLLAERPVSTLLAGYSLDEFIGKYGLDGKVVNQLTDDLLKNRGKALVIAGNKLPESTHIAVNLLNEVLGNTKVYSEDSSEVELMPLSTEEELEGLMNDMKSGKTSVVIHYGTNPVFDLPPEYGYAETLSKVPLSVTMTEMMNETAALSSYALAMNHPFESWGDYQTRTGFISMQQPVISPLYNTRQKEAILLNWIKAVETGLRPVSTWYRDFLKTNWEQAVYPTINQMTPFTSFWNAALHDGGASISQKGEEEHPPAPLQRGNVAEAFLQSAGKFKASKDYVVLLNDNMSVGADGRFANNGWLQELPHPVSKIVWDNYAAISVQTASELGLNSNDVVEIKIGDKTAEIPVFIQPGVADKVIEVELGYGRKTAGAIGSGVGHDVNKLRGTSMGILRPSADGNDRELTSGRLFNNAAISKTGKQYELVSTVEHHLIDQTPLLKDIQFKRNIIQEGTLKEYKSNPEFIRRKTAAEEAINMFPSVNQEHQYKQLKWGMAIDLNKCSGCSACVIACVAENNVPVVGKEQVRKSREMHWLRIDRYYSGTPEAPKANFQPMLCQHCDFAPCENVCPVVATSHSSDGLNQMTYNRCVGTRYCSNNCPYKVRRFNYFNFRDHVADEFYEKEPIDLMYNPEVTVRSRGVMEKCTFCIQRIMDERQKAAEQKRIVKASNVTTACQDACPAYAIVFGDVNEQESEVKTYTEHELAYTVLDELKVRPNVTYITKLRNE